MNYIDKRGKRGRPPTKKGRQKIQFEAAQIEVLNKSSLFYPILLSAEACAFIGILSFYTVYGNKTDIFTNPKHVYVFVDPLSGVEQQIISLKIFSTINMEGLGNKESEHPDLAQIFHPGKDGLNDKNMISGGKEGNNAVKSSQNSSGLTNSDGQSNEGAGTGGDGQSSQLQKMQVQQNPAIATPPGTTQSSTPNQPSPASPAIITPSLVSKDPKPTEDPTKPTPLTPNSPTTPAEPTTNPVSTTPTNPTVASPIQVPVLGELMVPSEDGDPEGAEIKFVTNVVMRSLDEFSGKLALQTGVELPELAVNIFPKNSVTGEDEGSKGDAKKQEISTSIKSEKNTSMAVVDFSAPSVESPANTKSEIGKPTKPVETPTPTTVPTPVTKVTEVTEVTKTATPIVKVPMAAQQAAPAMVSQVVDLSTPAELVTPQQETPETTNASPNGAQESSAADRKAQILPPIDNTATNSFKGGKTSFAKYIDGIKNSETYKLAASAKTEASYIDSVNKVFEIAWIGAMKGEKESVGRILSGKVERFCQISPKGKIFNIKDISKSGEDVSYLMKSLDLIYSNLELPPMSPEVLKLCPNGIAFSTDFSSGKQ